MGKGKNTEYRFERETTFKFIKAQAYKEIACWLPDTKNKTNLQLCLLNSSYPMPLTRVRKLMDELVSSCRI